MYHNQLQKNDLGDYTIYCMKCRAWNLLSQQCDHTIAVTLRQHEAEHIMTYVWPDGKGKGQRIILTHDEVAAIKEEANKIYFKKINWNKKNED